MARVGWTDRRLLVAGLWVGLTAALIGYLTVWLPGPAAGLRLIGLELGEWIKFLGVGQSRNYFYTPPILLGLIMVLITAGWPGGRWQTWAFRGLAVVVSLLAFPAIAAITGEPRSEWLARLAGIGLVVVAIVGVALAPGRGRWAWWGVLVLGLLGFVLPLWQYGQVQPVVTGILRQPVGIGLGLWLNSAGFLLIIFVAGSALLADAKSRPAVLPDHAP
jgi:hypothetical protein